MKSFTTVLFVCAFSLTTHAQGVEDDITMIQSIFGKEKRNLVSEYMQLKDGAAFWQVYDAFEAERKELGRKRLLLINDYAANYAALDDDKADQIASAMLKNNLAYEKLHKKYYQKFKKASSAREAAKFMQLETYIQNSARAALQDNIPFIDELNDLMK